MATPRRMKVLAGLGAALGLWTTGAGCLTGGPSGKDPGSLVTPAAVPAIQVRAERPESRLPEGASWAAAQSPTITPRTQLEWSLLADQMPANRPMSQTTIVGPDGTIAIGPYGTVRVAGLSPEQAQVAVAKHLARYLSHPRVLIRLRVDTLPTTTETSSIEWHAARGTTAPSAGTSFSTWRPAERQSGTEANPVSRVAWQTSANAPAPAFRASAAADANDPDPQLLHQPRLKPVPKDVPPVHMVVPAPGHALGPVGLPPLPRELNKAPLPPYRIEPPDILLVEVLPIGGELKSDQQIRGQHLVRPDGTVGLGIYGSVYVAGMTFDEARDAIAQLLIKRNSKIKADHVNVDVLAYNSKFYYVITDGAGYGEQVVRVPVTGNETVLDAISLINGLSPVSSKKHIWLARRNPGAAGTEFVYPVDWIGIAERGSAATNYQIMPGDRVYVKADGWRSTYTRIDKVLAPVERLLGVTLLGSETYNSIAGRSTGGSTGR